MNKITIVTTTYYPKNDMGKARHAIADVCMRSWFNHLKFDGEIELHIADDGSEIKTQYDSRQERKGVGASLNAGFRAAFNKSDVALYIVDDWELTQEIDITPWVNLLIHNNTIGMVRIGPPHPGLSGKIEMYREGFAITLNRHNFAYGMRPSIYHKRFFDAYGPFEEDISCWECERKYNEHFCNSSGPEIVYALPFYWNHIDTFQSGQIEPKGVMV